jgi:hypothetical protein
LPGLPGKLLRNNRSAFELSRRHRRKRERATTIHIIHTARRPATYDNDGFIDLRRHRLRRICSFGKTKATAPSFALKRFTKPLQSTDTSMEQQRCLGLTINGDWLA